MKWESWYRPRPRGTLHIILFYWKIGAFKITTPTVRAFFLTPSHSSVIEFITIGCNTLYVFLGKFFFHSLNIYFLEMFNSLIFYSNLQKNGSILPKLTIHSLCISSPSSCEYYLISKCHWLPIPRLCQYCEWNGGKHYLLVVADDRKIPYLFIFPKSLFIIISPTGLFYYYFVFYFLY